MSSLTPQSKLAAALGAAALLATGLAACGGGTSASPKVEWPSASTTPSATESAEAETTESAATTDDATTETAAFDYSEGLDDNGFVIGVTAKDYVELPNYEAFPVPASVANITDEAVQSEVDSILSGYGEATQVTDRAVVDGDTVNIDYVGSVDGVEFDGGTTNGAGTDVTIGTTTYIDDFLEQLIGHMPGDTFDINVTFPDDYGVDELNGKDAVFVTTVNYISETILPDITDAWVAENLSESYGWNTIAEMQDGIRASLRETAIQNYIYEYLTTEVQISEVPQAMLDKETNAMLAYYQSAADYYQVTLEEYLSTYEGLASLDELYEASASSIQTTVVYALVVQAIAEDAGWTVTEEDLAAFFLANAGSEDYSTYEAEYGLGYLKQLVLAQNVIDYIYEHCVTES
ncbi:MAG: FKBP-type peptidyl-prolyl cis-trans isomerase [Bifidobacteriaceae bacterium]|nr:FKBP-type peptidyl-prolyl cis-trans isomerase [Bifidobacteriaceae bacterium]